MGIIILLFILVQLFNGISPGASKSYSAPPEYNPKIELNMDNNPALPYPHPETVQLPWSWDINEECAVKEPANPKFTPVEIRTQRDNWQTFMQNLTITPQVGNLAQGILMTSTDRSHQQLLTLIFLLRDLGCEYPIQVFYFGNELSDRNIRQLESLSHVTTADMAKISGRLFASKKKKRFWEMKGASMVHCKFNQFIYMDVDNLPVRDPSFLFDTPAFEETGALFWSDYQKSNPESQIWKVLDIKCTGEFEQESGQVVLDKGRPEILRALHLATYMQSKDDFYYKLFWGDKETFRLAFRALDVPYHMVRHHVAPLGVTMSNGKFCGHSMAQFAPYWHSEIHGKPPVGSEDADKTFPLFVHHNIPKYNPSIDRTQDGIHFHSIEVLRQPEPVTRSGGARSDKTIGGICTYMHDANEPSGYMSKSDRKPFSDLAPGFEERFKKANIRADQMINAVLND